jgi:hypothetical protein
MGRELEIGLLSGLRALLKDDPVWRIEAIASGSKVTP